MALPTVFFIHGAWHDGSGWDATRKELAKQGYPSEAIDMPTVGCTDANAGAAEDIAACRAVIERLVNEGKDVVVVSHSYGGVPGSNAVKGLGKKGREAKGEKGGVIQFLYMASFAIPKGTSLLDGLGGNDLPWFQKKDGFVSSSDEHNVFYHDCDRAEADAMIASLKPEPYRILTDNSEFEPWNNDINVGYVFCDEDHAIPLAVQEQMASQFPEGSFRVHLKASHSPFMSMPKELSDALVAGIKHVQA